MKKLWVYAVTLLSLVLMGCNNGDDGLLNTEFLVVTPEKASISIGEKQQYIATLTLSNGSKRDVTNDAATNWTSRTESASIDANGLVQGERAGSSIITANYNGFSGSAELTVTSPILTSIEAAPATIEVNVGMTERLIATGHYSDGTEADITSEVNWFGQDTSIATVVDGTITGFSVGKTTTLATLNHIKSNVINIEVTPKLLSLTIDEGPVVELSDRMPSLPLHVTAHYADGSTRDVTSKVSWNVSSGSALYRGTETIAPRVEVIEQVVYSTVDTLPTYDYVKKESGIKAELQGVESEETIVLQCLTYTSPEHKGTCLKELPRKTYNTGTVYGGANIYPWAVYGGMTSELEWAWDDSGWEISDHPKLRTFVCASYGKLVGEDMMNVDPDLFITEDVSIGENGLFALATSESGLVPWAVQAGYAEFGAWEQDEVGSLPPQYLSTTELLTFMVIPRYNLVNVVICTPKP